jgi:hypothetical protein
MTKATSLVLGFVMTLVVFAAPMAVSAQTTPEEIAAQREAKRLEVKRKKAEIIAQRELQGTTKKLSLKDRVKAYKERMASKDASDVVETKVPQTIAEKFKTRTGVQYKNAELGFDFASNLWNGYTKFAAVHNHYPELTWFENIVGYNLPIYLNDSGFSLDSGENNYFIWDIFSDEWKVFYTNHLSMKRDGSMVYLRFDLPEAVQTTEYGTLEAGTWYFTNTKGLLAEEDFKKSSTTYVAPIEERIADSKRVFENVLAIQKALGAYHADVRGYPVAFDRPFELGENGLNGLYRTDAFHGKPENNKAYLTDIKSGYPSTKIMYDSRAGGQDYVITFTIYGSYDQYEPGVYEVGPYSIRKIANLK